MDGDRPVGVLRAPRAQCPDMPTPKPGQIRCPTCQQPTPPAAYCTQLGKRPAVADRHREQWDAVTALARSGLHAPLTSSAGRLFDAVASLAEELGRTPAEIESYLSSFCTDLLQRGLIEVAR